MWNLTTNNSPFYQLRNLQKEMNDLFTSGLSLDRSSFPRVNIYEDGNGIKIFAEMPGLSKEDININLLGNQLAIEAEKKQVYEDKDYQIHRSEIDSGKFIRSFNLPYEVNSNCVEAKLRNGILELVLPRAEQSKPKKISVSVE